MAGGVGSRFWPLSTPEYHKQFIDILGCGRTLIQLTVDRFKSICPMQNFWVVTNAKYVDIVKQQLPEIPAEHILAEPAARNSTLHSMGLLEYQERRPHCQCGGYTCRCSSDEPRGIPQGN